MYDVIYNNMYICILDKNKYKFTKKCHSQTIPSSERR